MAKSNKKHGKRPVNSQNKLKEKHPNICRSALRSTPEPEQGCPVFPSAAIT
jgi:hypothetical protein